jgi:hypothetical protein
MNPAWIAMQNQLNNRAIQQINAATRATIAATNAENAREQAMISGLQNDSFNDVINGVQDTERRTPLTVPSTSRERLRAAVATRLWRRCSPDPCASKGRGPGLCRQQLRPISMADE